MGWAGTYSVTAYVGNVRFSRPVKVGDLVEATAQLIHTGRSSMHILVTVRSGNALDQLLTEATKCLMIFVTMGPDGRSTAVPPWQPITDEDREQQASAQRRIALRADIEAAMAAQQYTEKGTAPSVVLRFLAAPTDINWGGKVHGGIVMRWIDETAHVLASQWTASTANVAVYAGGVRFYQPLLIGHLVEVEARLLLTRTSHMHPSATRVPLVSFLRSDHFEWWIFGAPHRPVDLLHGIRQWLLGQAVLIGLLGHRDGDCSRDRPEVVDWWQQRPAWAGRVGERRNGVCGRSDHGVGVRRARTTATPRPSPGKTNALLAWAMV